MKRWLKTLKKTPRACGTFLIWCYQKTFSPDHGFLHLFIGLSVGCRFYPTCSEYARESLRRFGLIRGSAMALWRLLRCHPWAAGGYDPTIHERRGNPPQG